MADIQRMLAKQDFPYQLTDMGTIIQGEINDLLALAGKLHEQSFSSGIKRVVTQIVIDDRRDKSVTIGDKISSVRKRLD